MDTTQNSGTGGAPQSAPDGAPTITLGGRSEVLLKPTGMVKQGLRAHLVRFEENPALLTAVAAAALALCWPPKRRWIGNHRPGRWKIINPIEEYGANVLNDLDELYGGTSAGVAELQTALMSAFSWAVNQGLIEREVQEVENFSERPEAAPSSA